MDKTTQHRRIIDETCPSIRFVCEACDTFWPCEISQLQEKLQHAEADLATLRGLVEGLPVLPVEDIARIRVAGELPYASLIFSKPLADALAAMLDARRKE